jgi:hypothetical protein
VFAGISTIRDGSIKHRIMPKAIKNLGLFIEHISHIIFIFLPP